MPYNIDNYPALGTDTDRATTRNQITRADDTLAWNGGDLAQIRDRWDDNAMGGVLARTCGDTRIPADATFAVLEALRHARSDVRYLLSVIAHATRP